MKERYVNIEEQNRQIDEIEKRERAERELNQISATKAWYQHVVKEEKRGVPMRDVRNAVRLDQATAGDNLHNRTAARIRQEAIDSHRVEAMKAKWNQERNIESESEFLAKLEAERKRAVKLQAESEELRNGWAKLGQAQLSGLNDKRAVYDALDLAPAQNTSTQDRFGDSAYLRLIGQSNV